MQIRIRTQPAPTIPEYITQALNQMSPRVFMEWNKTAKNSVINNVCIGRWEIWCELGDTTHPDAVFSRSRADRWNSKANCWMRKLQTYTNADGSFAPIDERLLVGLELADTWNNRLFYEDNVEAPHAALEDAETRKREQIYADGADYFRHHDRLLVGRHFNSGWRWRNR